MNQVIVIGGGAAGMMAAITAARNGAEVTILEKNNRIGKKILATGNGRCNYTNRFASVEDYNHPDFVGIGLALFGAEESISFFKELGIEPKEEEAGKCYPMSEQASSIVDVFLYELDRLSIPVHTEVQVLTIQKKSNRFLVKTNKGEFASDQLILATGGKALPASGSDGSGYAYAMSLGHSIRNVYPSINKLKLNSPHLKHLSGVKIKSSAILYVNEEPIQIEEDDILFTAVGISGPTILQLSREATLAYEAGKHVEIGIKLLPTMLIKEVVARLKNFEDKTIEQALIGLVNKRFIGPLVKEAGLPSIHALVSSLSKREKEDLINLLFDWRFEVSGYLGFEEAQATIGGVSIPEINPLTMESNLVPGLYFAGEVMDVDGRCGGYNLQWAWTSGYLAGLSSAIAEKTV